ncbi:MAG: BACON domain-containing protein, partial [Bryobacterales bacterium]|nr:BACON domain-containing protein [Bryobacterales bacterium]
MRQGIGAGWQAMAAGVCFVAVSGALLAQTPTKEYIYLGGRLVAIESTGASVQVVPTAISAGAVGSSGSIAVTAAVGVAWSAAVSGGATWIAITSGGTGTGSGTVGYTVVANTAATERVGEILIGGTTVTITQAGAGAGAGSGAIAVSQEIYLIGLEGGVLGVSVQSPAGVAWTATADTGASWITIPTGSSGSGLGTMVLQVAATGAARSGTVSLSSPGRPVRKIWVYQGGTGQQPTAPTVTPSSGTATGAVFTISSTTSAGGAYVGWIHVLINTRPDGRSACYLLLDNTTNQVFLLDDAASNWWVEYGSIGEAKVVQNSQCAVNLEAATKVVDGSGVQFRIPIAFQPVLAGPLMVLAASLNLEHQISPGWLALVGTWQAYTTPGPPASLSVNPNGGGGANQVFAFRMESGGGARYIESGLMMIHTALLPDGGCYLHFERSTRVLTLLAQTGQAAAAGVMGGAGTIANSYCSINLAGSGVQESGNELIVTVAAAFPTLFSGQKNTYLYAVDRAGQPSPGGWVQVGTWLVDQNPVQISASSVTPSGTSGAYTLYDINLSAANGGASITPVGLFIGADTLDNRDACYVMINGSTVTLAKDAGGWINPAVYGSMWSGGETLGSGAVLENAQCKVAMAPSSRQTIGSNQLRVRLAIQALPLFAGQKSFYVQAYSGSYGLPGGFQFMRSETFLAAPAAPKAVGTPALSGAGLTGTLTTRVESPAGADFIHSGVVTLDTDPVNVSSAKWCKIVYHRSSGRVQLPDPTLAGGGPMGWIGQATPIATPNCQVNLQGASLTAQGTVLQSSFPVSFLGTFSGVKKVLTVGLDKALQFGPLFNVPETTLPNAYVGTWNVAPGSSPIAVSPAGASMPAQGGSGSFAITQGAGWTLGFDATKVTVLDGAPPNGLPLASGQTGFGIRTLPYVVAPNSGAQRTIPITLTAANPADSASLVITQAAAPVCVVSPGSVFLSVRQSMPYTANIGSQTAAQAGYTVTWTLYRKVGTDQYVEASNLETDGTMLPNGQYTAPSGTTTVYARATCKIGSYTLAPAYGEIQVRSYYPDDCNYRVSLSDGSSVGRYVEMLLWQQNTGCSGQLQSPAAVDVLVSGANATSTAGQCHVTYYPGGGQMLSLMDDTGLAPARPVSWFPVKALINGLEQVTNPGRGMTQNSQCLVDYARAWEKFGNVPLPFMKWNMPVYFHPSFVGGKD